MAWLTAPAPMACTSARLCSRTTPAIAPATAEVRELAETLIISMVISLQFKQRGQHWVKEIVQDSTGQFKRFAFLEFYCYSLFSILIVVVLGVVDMWICPGSPQC